MPGFSSSSKLLSKKWQDRQYQQHQDKIRQMKHGIDNKSPKRYPHLVLRLKKVQQEESRQAEIEHNNRLLLQKMTSIMRKKGRVDNWNEYHTHSLNRSRRDREKERIADENVKIAKSLQKVQPLYDVDKWENDYKKHEYYLDLWETTTKEYETTPRSEWRDYEYEDDFEDDSSSRLPRIESRETHGRQGSFQSSTGSQVTKLPKIHDKKTEGLVDADCKTLFKAGKQLANPEAALLRCLIRRSPEHRLAVKERFQEMYDLDLASELKNALGSKYASLIDALLSDPSESDADAIGDAIQSNNAAAAIAILSARDAKSLKALQKAYKEKYEVSLEEDIRNKILDEDCQNLLLVLLKGGRPESDRVDKEQAEADAQALIDAGAGRFTDPNGVFMTLLAERSNAHMQAVFKAYKQLSGEDITSAMKADGCSKNFIKAVKNMGGGGGGGSAEYYADLIHAHLKPDDPELAKILLMCSEQGDMAAIKRAYKKKYKMDLTEALQRKGGEPSKHLVEIVNKPKPGKQDDKSKKQGTSQQAPAEKKTKGKGQAKASKGKGTVKEASNFNPDDDVTKLHEAMKGWGTDEQPLIDILSARSNKQRQELKKKYKEKYDKDLTEELKSELSGDFEELMMALMMSPVEYDAHCMREAVKGLGTNEATLIGILCTRNKKELNAISTQYKKSYDRDLQTDVVGDTSGDFQELLVQLMKGERDQGTGVDQKLAKDDAQKLYKDGETVVELKDDVFRDIICKRNKAQVKATAQEYKKLSGKSLEEAIKKSMSGDAEDAYLNLMVAVQDPIEFYARRLNDAMAGLGTKDTQLIRIIVSRSEVDLADIKVKYKELYGKTLAESIESDTSGDYKKLLLALVK